MHRDLAGERQREWGQQGPVGANARPERPGRDALRRGGIAEDDPNRAPAAPLDEDRLAGCHVRELIRHEIGPRPGTGDAGGVDRNLDVTAGVWRVEQPEIHAARHRVERRDLGHRARRRRGGRRASSVPRG